MIIFERKYPVNIFNTDLTGKLSAGSLFSFCEDIAGRHASVLGWGRDSLMSGGNFWALSRMMVKIDRFPAALEEITLRTWPRGTDSIYALRDFEMYDDQGNVIAAATSSWIIVDYNTRKVQRPDKTLSLLNIEFPEKKAVGGNAGKIPSVPADGQTVTSMMVRTEDIDVNMHVNNARYVTWVLNSYPTGQIISHVPATIEVNYVSEGHADEAVNIITAKSAGLPASFIHSVVRQNDNSEMCRIRISWREDQV
jgi:acyl-ACP thioesterase